MDFCNNKEVFKNVKKAHIFLQGNLHFGLSESLRNVNHAATPDNKETVIAVLPETTKLDIKQNKHKSGTYWKNKISITVTEISDNFKKELHSYTNRKVILVLELYDERIFIYGNNEQPLDIIYKELNPTKNDGVFGYELTISGDTTTEPKETTLADFNYNPFLGSWLTHNL